MTLKICFITAEMAPLAKVGGLGDVAGALPRYLREAGHDVRVFLPLYRDLDAEAANFEPVAAVQDVPVRIGRRTFPFSLYTVPVAGITDLVHCVHCPALYDREGVYTSDDDEAERFVLLSRAAIESCQRLGWAPDVFHANDWQTALVPLYLGAQYAWDRMFADSKTVLTIHNIGYQGVFPAAHLERLGLEAGRRFFDPEDIQAGRINFMKVGVSYADLLTTVSPTYAREIQTETYGMGLEHALARRSTDLVGILNGVDYHVWHPRIDSLIPFRYSEKSLWRKRKNKEALHEEFDLHLGTQAPLMGMVSRLTAQKGLELVMEVMPSFLDKNNVRLVVVGTGEERYERFFRQLSRVFPSQLYFHRGYDNELAHRVEAASDIFVMPSLYEPCGLNQMYSLKYGTVPIVRRTGGLADSVELWDPSDMTGTGFVFEHFTPDGLEWALSAAYETFRDAKAWKQLVLNGMSQDFSWESQTKHYIDAYQRVVATARAPGAVEIS